MTRLRIHLVYLGCRLRARCAADVQRCVAERQVALVQAGVVEPTP